MNELTTFEKEHIEVFKNMAALDKSLKAFKKEYDKAKADLLKAMEQAGIYGIDNEYIKVTYVPLTESVKPDWKAFELEEPKKYEKIVGKYNKMSTRKAYLVVTAR